MSPNLKAERGTVPKQQRLMENIATSTRCTASWFETVAGVDGSWRRTLAWWTTAWTLATVIRMACFMPGILGNYLFKNLSPIERESVGWSYILLVRGIDLAVGAWIWNRIDGETRKDGALFGGLIASVSRVSLYAFEHSYFLLTASTVFSIFLIDVLSLSCAFALLPYFIPHSIPARPPMSALTRLRLHPEISVNIVCAVAVSTLVAATATYAAERLGGTEFVKRTVYHVTVPSIYSRDSLTPIEMLKNPSVEIPSLRELLSPPPLSMPRHLWQTSALAILVAPFVSILPWLSASQIAILTMLVIAPPSTLLLWDVLPINALGAIGVGLGLGLRGSLVAAIEAWILEELRMSKHHNHLTIIAEDDKEIDVIDADVVTQEMENGDEEVSIDAEVIQLRKRNK